MASVMSRPTNRGNLFGKNSYTRAQVQNVKKSRVYVFGDADMHDDDDVVEFEMGNIPDIRSRKAPKHIDPKEKEPIYFEREITEGDSLQSMSLQYGCQVFYPLRLMTIEPKSPRRFCGDVIKQFYTCLPLAFKV